MADKRGGQRCGNHCSETDSRHGNPQGGCPAFFKPCPHNCQHGYIAAGNSHPDAQTDHHEAQQRDGRARAVIVGAGRVALAHDLYYSGKTVILVGATGACSK